MHGMLPKRGVLVGGLQAVSEVDSVVDSTVNIVVVGAKTTGDAVKQGIDVAGKGLSYLEQALSKVSPVVEGAKNVVAPIVGDVVEKSKPIASSLLEQANRSVSSAGPQVEKLLQDAGVSGQVIRGAENGLGNVIQVSRPIVSSAIEFVTTTPPILLAEYGAAGTLVYLLAPKFFAFGISAVRGYSGEVSPAASLDKLCSDSSSFILDVRTAREKESAGIPNVRERKQYIEIEFASIEDGRLRKVLKDVSALESTITALQIAAIKKLSKKSVLYIMDKGDNRSKAVAKRLAAKGFKNVFVMKGGFSAWQRERLPTQLAASVSKVEVVSPGAVLFGSTKRSTSDGSSRAIAPPTQRRGLPSSTEAGRAK